MATGVRCVSTNGITRMPRSSVVSLATLVASLLIKENSGMVVARFG